LATPSGEKHPPQQTGEPGPSSSTAPINGSKPLDGSKESMKEVAPGTGGDASKRNSDGK